MMCRLVSAAIVALAPVWVAAPLAAQQPPLTPLSIDALRLWVNLVNAHRPGSPDAAVQRVAAMSYRARFELYRSHTRFMRVVRENYLAAGSDLEFEVVQIGQSIRRNPGTDAFLKRAATLHGDAAVFAERFLPPRDDEPAGTAVGARNQQIPLLNNERITLTRDGEIVGFARVDWNLPFARSLLDVVLEDNASKADGARRSDQAAAREFAGEWYHATTAHLFANGMYAEANKHLQHAAGVLPDDVRLIFDRGTYAETFGLPIYQAVPDTRVPAEAKTNAEAERLYRRALEVDPSFVEARVRLARLLTHRGQHDEAEAEIGRARAARPNGVLGFYTNMVAGRIAVARGRFEDALQRYREASALFEHAQSAILGASHAALMVSDVSQAIAPLGRLARDAAEEGADPWLDYRLGAGRDAAALLKAFWQRAAQ